MSLGEVDRLKHIIKNKDKKIRELQALNGNRWMEKQETETIFAQCLKQVLHD